MPKQLNRLKELRQEKGISLHQLSETLKREYNISVSASQLMYYEKGEREPRNEEIWEKLADFFKVPLSYLLAYDQVINNAEKELPVLQETVNAQYEKFYNLYKQTDEKIDKLTKTFGELLQLDPDAFSPDVFFNFLDTAQKLVGEVYTLQGIVENLLTLKSNQHNGDLLQIRLLQHNYKELENKYKKLKETPKK